MDNIDKSFVPTTDWMAEKYDEMNNQLFGGRLMECKFEVFTKGAGMEGGVLGWFCITGTNIRVKRNNRRIFKQTGWNEIFVERDNFVELCRPVIKLNGNYHGTEHSFLATLAHEMCHYYTYMNGYAPVQSHGREFKEIGAIVSARSKGMFSIQRLASAEEMNEMSLNTDMKEKKAKRLANKKASVSALLVLANNGQVKLTISSNNDLLKSIKKEEERRGEDVFISNNAEVIEYLFNKGFKKNMRTWRYWSLEDKPWLGELKSMLPEVSGETLGIRRPAVQQIPPQQTPTQPKLIFSIKTSNGVFETECSSYVELRNKLKQRFPNMSYETITKLMDNKANFKTITENKLNTKSIIKEVIEEFINDEMGSDSVAISPDMNLGLQSPLEME